MIIEVDVNTKESKVYSSLYEFCAAHSDELAEKYRKQFAYAADIEYEQIIETLKTLVA